MAKQNKTEQPTQWRLQKAKEKGDVPRSRELITSVTIFSTIVFFLFYLPYASRELLNFARNYFNFSRPEDFSAALAYNQYQSAFYFYLKLLMPFFFLLIMVAFITTVVQGGFRVVPDNLKLKFDKLNFIKGLKKIVFSVESFYELLKTLLKTVVILFIAYLAIRNELAELPQIAHKPLPELLSYMGMIFFRVSLAVTIFLFVLATADYLWVRWRYKQRLKMTKEEVKDEYKEKEGDPQIKSKQRSIQYQKAIQRMMAQVPKADVVITNPTHFALALQYEYKKMVAPKVIAKGQDLLAEKIKTIARENGVPVVENPPLVRALYKVVEVGDFIPVEFFKPVAEILAYIYKLRGRRIG